LYDEYTATTNAIAEPGGDLYDEYTATQHPAAPTIFGDLVPREPPRAAGEMRDLFGEDVPEPGETAPTPQGSLFDADAGTLQAQNLAATEARYRAELPLLHWKLEHTTDASTRAVLATRIAEMERLVNRANAISADELRTRRLAGEPPALTINDMAHDASMAVPDGATRGPAPARETPEPRDLQDAAVRLHGVRDNLRRWLAPQTRGAKAGITGRVLRRFAGQRVRELAVAREAMRDFARMFDPLSDADRVAFIDRMERGAIQPTQELTAAAATLRGLLDSARDEVRALGTGKLEHYIADYFPHLWKDPEGARDVIGQMMSKRSLTGAGSFLKQRSVPTLREGIAAGLEPVTTTPVDLVMLKLREMRKYIEGQRELAELKARGIARFVGTYETAPTGHVQINDKIATVYGPPTVTIKEAYDFHVRQGVEKVLNAMGVTHTRSPRIGTRTAAGFASGTGHAITTRFGSENSVIIHELGHALDAQLQLWDRLTDIPGTTKDAIAERKMVHGELRALADLRYEGVPPEQVSAHYKTYVRERGEKIANAITALIYAPERMQEVAPTIKARLTQILASDPRAKLLLDVKPSLVLGSSTADVPVGGMVIKGHYYAPEPAARVLNNYLSPGFRGNELFDAWRVVGNVLNQAQLGLSAFHLGFTSVDTAVSKAALGLEQLASGRPLQALRSFATAPIAPVTTAMTGARVIRAYLRPGSEGEEMAAIADALEAAGGTVRMDDFYKTGAARSFWQAFTDARRQGPTGRRVLAGGKATALSVPAAFEAASKPILEVLVPMQKAGVFADLWRFEMSRLPKDATSDMMRAAASTAWNSVDNRLGQLVYDNLFWHRMTKDVALASVRSVGWNLGTFRELGGGASDLAHSAIGVVRNGRLELTHRGAYVVALPFAVGLMGSVIHYLYTGTAPATLKDMFYPRTGRENPDGTQERLALPSYVKDVLNYSRHPWRTISGKVHPAITSVVSMLENQDWYGNEIRNPDDPLVRQVEQEVKYLAEQFEPFGIRNFEQERRESQPLSRSVGAFVGLTPAPREVVRTPAQNLMRDYLGSRVPGGATPEAAENRNERARLRLEFEQHRPHAMQDLQRAITQGAIRQSQAAALVKGLHEPPGVSAFKALRLNEAVKVYQLADSAERARWGRAFQAKVNRYDPRSYTPTERAAILAALAKLGRAHAGGPGH
jgi:hypothetical protein